jgi:hypothetical protein
MVFRRVEENALALRIAAHLQTRPVSLGLPEKVTFSVADELAHGPTVAHAAAKRMVHIAVNEGVLAADEAMGEVQKPIWASEDLKLGLASFRENGPGLAKFVGR